VFHREFTNRRELASYLGLTPSPWASGSVQLDQGISKAGNARMRTILIEIAWLWTRHQPGSHLAGSGSASVRPRGGCAGSWSWRWPVSWLLRCGHI
jgi:transposase